MNESVNERSEFRESVARVGKILGGVVVGAVSGYAMAKGVEMMIPFGDPSVEPLYEGLVAGTFAVGGGFAANELAE